MFSLLHLPIVESLTISQGKSGQEIVAIKTGGGL
jgi:hypothetical protein